MIYTFFTDVHEHSVIKQVDGSEVLFVLKFNLIASSMLVKF